MQEPWRSNPRLQKLVWRTWKVTSPVGKELEACVRGWEVFIGYSQPHLTHGLGFGTNVVSKGAEMVGTLSFGWETWMLTWAMAVKPAKAWLKVTAYSTRIWDMTRTLTPRPKRTVRFSWEHLAESPCSTFNSHLWQNMHCTNHILECNYFRYSILFIY